MGRRQLVIALALLAGLLLGGGSVWWLQRDELARLRADKREAEDRLFYGFKHESLTPAPRAVEIKPLEALPKELLDEVNQWEDPETRAAEESRLRAMYFDRGMGVQAILRELEQPKH